MKLLFLLLLLAAPAYAGDPPVVPDNQLTPGVSATTDVNEICGKVNGLTYSKQHRKTTSKMKHDAFARYGLPYPKTPGQWEVDHRCELSIGCADDIRNLWPQPGAGTWNFHKKDKLEDLVHQHVCVKRDMTPADAQALFLAPADWRAGYCKFFADDPACATLH